MLSITARAKRKEAEKKKDEKQPEKMDVDDDTKKDAGQEKDKKEGEKDEKEKVRTSRCIPSSQLESALGPPWLVLFYAAYHASILRLSRPC